MNGDTGVGIMTADQAVDMVRPGDILALGGLLLENRPCELVRALIRRRAENLDLTLLSSPAAGWDFDVLIAAGLAKAVIVGHVSLGPVGLAPAFSGHDHPDLDVVWCDEALLIGALMAAAERTPVRALSSVGPNDVTDGCSLIRGVNSDGMTEVRAIAPDVAFLHAPIADSFGNLYYRGSQFADIIIARAAKLVIVEVDRIVDEAPVDVRCAVPAHLIDFVVEAAEGAWPGGVVGGYLADFAHLSLYQSMVRERRLGEYLDRFVFAGQEPS